jgi:hypothetical protein
MSYRRTRRVVLASSALALLVSAGLADAQPAPPAPIPLQRWNYAVKFVCGLQRPVQEPGETIVKPGNYATEINIFNPFNVEDPIRKRVILLVDFGKPIGREPEQQGPTGFDRILLKPSAATMDDCNRLWTLTHPGAALPIPMPLTIGFLVLDSPRELDIDAVYTAAVSGFPGTVPTGISIDVERVPGRRLPLLTPVPVPTDPNPVPDPADPGAKD